jgi:acylglycerol lipase
MPSFTEAGIAVYGFDQRGWGRSVADPSQRGKTGTSEVVMGDIATFVKAHISPSVPTFMAGHSMGGQETLHFIAEGPEDVKKQIKGFILSSPYLALHPDEQPSWIKIKAGRLAMKLLPNFQLVNPLKAENMSHDPKMNQELVDDKLCHDTGTLEGLGDMLDRAEQLDTHKCLVQDWDGLHMLFLHGDGDKCTSHVSTQRYFDKINVKDKKLTLFPDGYHCCKSPLSLVEGMLMSLVFYEPAHKDKFIGDIIEFVTTRTKQERSNGAQSRL